MKKVILEKGLILILFALVLVVFSFAEKDSKKLDQLYTTSSVIKHSSQYAASTAEPGMITNNETKN
jgi:hypothetical protein